MMAMDDDMNEYSKTAGETREEILEACQFAPLVGGGHSLLSTYYALKAIDDIKNGEQQWLKF